GPPQVPGQPRAVQVAVLSTELAVSWKPPSKRGPKPAYPRLRHLCEEKVLSSTELAVSWKPPPKWDPNQPIRGYVFVKLLDFLPQVLNIMQGTAVFQSGSVQIGSILATVLSLQRQVLI
ncbi:hypothetical protein MTO96_043824, partial [Rhipicephalus appendiculatus]